MNDDLLKKIEELIPKFSKSQKLIANFILEHYEKAAYMTALKLGRTVGVSESTVVRFAIELGFEGYPQLQRSPAADGRNDSPHGCRDRLCRIGNEEQRSGITEHFISQTGVFRRRSYSMNKAPQSETLIFPSAKSV